MTEIPEELRKHIELLAQAARCSRVMAEAATPACDALARRYIEVQKEFDDKMNNADPLAAAIGLLCTEIEHTARHVQAASPEVLLEAVIMLVRQLTNRRQKKDAAEAASATKH